MTAYRLTPKQEKFCAVYLETGNASEAYRQAYNAGKMSDQAVWNEASKLLKHAQISKRVLAAKERVVELAEYSKAQAILDARMDREEARRLGQIGAAVSAGRLACDLSGYITEKKQVEHTGDAMLTLLGLVDGTSRKLPNDSDPQTTH